MEEMITREQMEKLKKLQDYLRSLESVAVAVFQWCRFHIFIKGGKRHAG